MTFFREFLDLAKMMRPRGWPKLLYYSFWVVYLKFFGVSPVKGVVLVFKEVKAYAGVGGNSGLKFLIEIVKGREYEDLIVESEDQWLIDVGANCGFTTLIICHQYPKLKAICFEPNPEAFSRLEKNIEINNMQARVRAIHAAVGRADEDITLQIDPGSSMGKVQNDRIESENNSTVTVSGYCLDGLPNMELSWPDLLKIDVEGHEVEVLLGAQEALSHARLIVMEVHSKALAQQCTEILLRAQFDLEQKGQILIARRQR